MTDITQDELNAVINAAKARQADITQGAWVYDDTIHRKDRQYHDDNIVSSYHYDHSEYGGDAGSGLSIDNHADADLITEAPNLNAAVIALDAELTKVKAAWEAEATANLDLVKRIEALERKLGYFEAHTIYNKP